VAYRLNDISIYQWHQWRNVVDGCARRLAAICLKAAKIYALAAENTILRRKYNVSSYSMVIARLA